MVFFLFLGLILLIGGCYGFWYAHSNEVKDKNGNKRRKFVFNDKAKKSLLEMAIWVCLMLGVFSWCDGCFKESPNASKDFHEWTGKPRNKTPFGY